jgi:hypothetical protein
MSLVQAALARAANSLSVSALAAQGLGGSRRFPAFARSPRARLEYQPT